MSVKVPLDFPAAPSLAAYWCDTMKSSPFALSLSKGRAS
jgi:hypothetical protein